MSIEDLGFVAQVSGLDVSFRITGQVPSTDIVEWDFGDDSTKYNKRTVTHTYKESGFYYVKVTVSSPKDPEPVSFGKTILVNVEAKTSLTNSIYELIKYYIPSEMELSMSDEEKALYINKWQLYIHPLVNHFIPLEYYSNELYYEGLENQLIMELAVWEFLSTKLMNLLARMGQYLANVTTLSEEESEGSSVSRGERIKAITTGPTEVQYYDEMSEAIANLYSTYQKALAPGGLIDTLKRNLCTLAERLEIYLPFCPNHVSRVVPRVVNRRDPGKLGGPNPTYPLSDGGTIIV